MDNNLVVFCIEIAKKARQGWKIDENVDAPSIMGWLYTTAMFKEVADESVVTTLEIPADDKKSRPPKGDF